MKETIFEYPEQMERCMVCGVCPHSTSNVCFSYGNLPLSLEAVCKGASPGCSGP